MLNQWLSRLSDWSDTFWGRSAASITIPIMDGPFKANRLLDTAEVVTECAGLEDVASSGGSLWFSAGTGVYRLDGQQTTLVRQFDLPVTALAVGGRCMVVALGGTTVNVFALVGNACGMPLAKLDRMAGQPLHCVNALAVDHAGAVLLSDGSTQHAPAHWCHDLMGRGASGRVGRWLPGTAEATLLADQLHYAFGVLQQAQGVLFSESWRHRVRQALQGQGAVDVGGEWVCYPSRMAASSRGGVWVSCFACRTQLVEFVLRETAYRKRMLQEVDPRYWIAPALSSGHTFLEPLQGAAIKQMGVMKPWAPPRSYGLVLRMAEDGRVLESLHSQVDGVHHGITAVAEHAGALYAVSKGSGRLLRVGLGMQEGYP
jgi:hypothetical protein